HTTLFRSRRPVRCNRTSCRWNWWRSRSCRSRARRRLPRRRWPVGAGDAAAAWAARVAVERAAEQPHPPRREPRTLNTPRIGARAAAGGEAAPGAAPAIANNPGAAAANPLGEACTDFLTPEQYAAKNGALAVVTIANFQQLSTMANPNAAGAFGGFGGGGRAGLNGPNYQVPKLQQQPACASVPSVTAGLAMTNSIFQGEKLSAQQVFYGAGSNARQDSFELTAAKKISLKVAIKSETNHSQNVIGILEGSDPVLKNEYV